MKTKPEGIKIIQITSIYHRGNLIKEIDGLGDDGNLYFYHFDSGEWKCY